MNAHTGSTDPGSKSAAEIEREVQQSRAEVEQTLDAIQARLSPGQLLDQAVGYFREGRGVEFARNLGDSITQNPVPLALVGVGLAWMMLGGQRLGHRGDRLESRYWDDDPDAFEDDRYSGLAEQSTAYMHSAADLSEGGYGDEGAGLGDDLRERGRAAKDKLGEFGDQAGSAAARAAEGVAHAGATIADRAYEARDRVSDAGARMAHRAREARGRAGDYGRRARRGVLRTLEEQPLVLGAVGLAIGAALGAALPASEAEDRLMGEARDETLRRVAKAGREQAEKARDAVGAVAAAAREEAHKQGLTPESSSEHSSSGAAAEASEIGTTATTSAGPATGTPYVDDPKAGPDRL